MNEVYKIVKKNSVPELTVIEKSNIKTEITLADTLSSLEYNKKQMESIEAEINLKKALITNVVTNFPGVQDIDPKMQIACHTYYEAGRYVKIAEDKLKEFKKAQIELQREVKEIREQTGIEKMSAEKQLEVISKINKKNVKK